MPHAHVPGPAEGGLTGRAVLVTGAAGDIGRAVCDRLLRAGARIVALDRDAGGLDALRSTHGADVRTRCADVAD